MLTVSTPSFSKSQLVFFSSPTISFSCAAESTKVKMVSKVSQGQRVFLICTYILCFACVELPHVPFEEMTSTTIVYILSEDSKTLELFLK